LRRGGPNPGRLGQVLPHHLTFAAVYNSLSQAYRTWQDEAQKNSLTDSLAMRRDGFVYELLCRRWYPVSELPFHLEPDDPNHPGQKSICEELTRIIESTPNFQTLKLQLLEAVWFGKAAVQCDWRETRVNGKRRTAVVYHEPVQGDKIVWKWGGTPGILVHATYDPGPQNRHNVQLTDRGRALFLHDPYFRERFLFHRFEPTDTDYLFEPEQAAAVQGLGIRARIYWVWFLRQELLSWVMDGLQRVSSNGMLYAYYPSGNESAQRAVVNALTDLIRDNVAAFPKDPANDDIGELIHRIEPTGIAYEVLIRMIEWAEGIIRRCIVGQTLTGEPAATGMGSGVAELQETTFQQIVRHDANSLAETLTRDFVGPLVRYNHWDYAGRHYYLQDLPFNIRLKLQAERPDMRERIDAAAKLMQLGVAIDLEDLRDALGFSKPRDAGNALPGVGAKHQQAIVGSNAESRHTHSVQPESASPAPTQRGEQPSD
jgi:phage gp29-like protein